MINTNWADVWLYTSIALFIGAVSFLASLPGCTAKDRAAVVRTISDIAAEVCVEGDSVQVCLKKCQDEADKRGK